MDSRMNKYNESEEEIIPSRVKRNQDIYNDIDKLEFDKVKTRTNIKIIDESPKEIDLEKIKKYVTSLNEETPERKVVFSQEKTQEEIKEENKLNENKVYDINSVIEKAKEEREVDYEEERHKKLRDTQYDILNQIKMYPEENQSNSLEEEFNTNERTLIDLINTVTIQKERDNLLSELQDDEDTSTDNSNLNEEIKKELEKRKEEEPKINEISEADKSFYSNSLSFNKEDFEVFDDLEKTVKKNNFLVSFGIFLLILIGLATIFVILQFVLNIDIIGLILE